jgi:hypothetical protein
LAERQVAREAGGLSARFDREVLLGHRESRFTEELADQPVRANAWEITGEDYNPCNS